jgi:hypothetical protein
METFKWSPGNFAQAVRESLPYGVRQRRPRVVREPRPPRGSATAHPQDQLNLAGAGSLSRPQGPARGSQRPAACSGWRTS